ncbi:Clavata3/ESR (CLE) protein [Quillaja saponaria]|uniref:Clavata3/ESR (CLE) protein n=1 Tax=Quillaja saponaria TaxID=32244 RepID=A0AAD7QEF4_QUISA|nr:Clavata3/ESR (CLE) protein [Quillaja saponaria]
MKYENGFEKEEEKFSTYNIPLAFFTTSLNSFCLSLLLYFVSAGRFSSAYSYGVARKTFLVSTSIDSGAKKSSSQVQHDCDKCKTKRFQHGDHLISSDNTTTSDDKRVVPTGPNPLHNR